MIKDMPPLPERLNRRLDAIFGKFPQETNTTHTVGGFGHGSTSVSQMVIRWVPQNKRFYFAFDRLGFVAKKPSTHTLGKAGGVRKQ